MCKSDTVGQHILKGKVCCVICYITSYSVIIMSYRLIKCSSYYKAGYIIETFQVRSYLWAVKVIRFKIVTHKWSIHRQVTYKENL